MENLKLYYQIESLPQDLKQEVKEFVQSLLERIEGNQVVKKERPAGLAKGMIQMKADFDSSLTDFNEYTE